MYELVHIKGNSYYIESPSRVGVVKTGEDEVCIIDAGNNRDMGKRIKRILDEQGWRLSRILVTHAHADHIGGCRYLSENTGCKVYASGIERDFTEHTILMPSLLYGASPLKELKHKFLLAEPTETLPLTDDSLPEGFRVIELCGHTPDMVGYLSPDGVAYIGDCLASRETIDKYGISYIYDVAGYLDTLSRVREYSADVFMPSHMKPLRDIRDIVDYNIKSVHDIGDRIVKYLEDCHSFDEILRELFSALGITMTVEQYALVGSTVRSYLGWLGAEGRIDLSCDDNTLVWRACK